ncbi:unnamed protein product, partial [Arabidopsis halleri]
RSPLCNFENKTTELTEKSQELGARNQFVEDQNVWQTTSRDPLVS